MKITKYPQSCLSIEKGGQAILIDPGTLVTAKYQLSDLGLVEAVLYTHQHADHFDPELLGDIHKADIEIYCNQDVATKIEGPVKVISDKDEFVVAGFNITAYELPHCKMVDGSDGPPNTGYVIDGHFFHPGDGTEIAGLEVDGVAAPIAGPDVSFKDAANLSTSVHANTVIPIHYDVFTANAELFKAQSERLGLKYKVVVLKDGESVEI